MKVRLRLSLAFFMFALAFGHAAGCSDDDGGTNPVCGNGIIEQGEQCDDGNNLNGDGCSGYCQSESNVECGNGIIEQGEQCDDGNNISGDGCSATCQNEGAATCGNGVVEAGEQCDDGNTVSGDGCSANCQSEGTATCGNGVIEVGEQCDDGNTVDGDGCSATCQNEITATCGNGVVEPGEQCDDGNTVDGDGCSSTCQTEAPTCGNGVVEAGEQCDDGNTVSGDGCSATCQNEGTATCGDGILQAGEQCDDGNTTGGDGCSPSCIVEACGNGVLDAGEQCDDGNMSNTDACPDGAGGTCANAACGDGFVYTGTEDCDDGNIVNGDGCSASCTTEVCGNGVLDAGEQCDDGNMSNTDACPDGVGGTCANAACGDGFVYAAVEQCDDGNTVSGDGCSSTCQNEGTATCGDGVLQAGEECDDGNIVNGDGCESDCTATSCSEAADCGNTSAYVCDVVSQSCSANQCTVQAGSCGTGCVGADPCCLEQETGTGLGACYEVCDPYDTPCPTGLECYNVTYNQGAGYCMNAGTAAIGAGCTPSMTDTGCVAGGVCLNDGTNNLCYEECDFFGAATCSGASGCFPFGYCDTAWVIDPATLGATCAAANPAGTPCSPIADGYEGTCQDDGTGTIACYQICQLWSRSGTVEACTTGTCQDLFGGDWAGDIGLCW